MWKTKHVSSRSRFKIERAESCYENTMIGYKCYVAMEIDSNGNRPKYNFGINYINSVSIVTKLPYYSAMPGFKLMTSLTS